MIDFIALILPQQSEAVQMADAMRSSGKIYVVVACITIVLLGLFIFLFRIDKRLQKMEKFFDEKN